MAPDAVIVGSRDFGMGKAKLLELLEIVGAPVLGGNVLDSKTEKPLFKDSIILERNGRKIAFFGVITANWGMASSPDNPLGIKVENPTAYARKVFASLKGKADMIIALTSLDDTELRSMTEALPDLKYVLRSNARGIGYATNQVFGKTTAISSLARGKALGLVRFVGKGNDFVDISSRNTMKSRKDMYDRKIQRMMKSENVDSVDDLLKSMDKNSSKFKGLQKYLEKMKEIDNQMVEFEDVENYLEVERVSLDSRVADDPKIKVMVDKVVEKYGDPGKIRRTSAINKVNTDGGKMPLPKFNKLGPKTDK